MFRNKWIKYILYLVVIGISAFVIFLATANHLLVRQSNVIKADAIIVISGGKGERVEHATQLFNKGYADTLIISGCPGNDSSIVQANYMQAKAVQNGVPRDNIILDVLDRHGLGTGVQAQNIRALLESHGFKSVILVTTDFHTSRSKMIFERAFKGLDVQLQISHPDQGIFEKTTWWQNSYNVKIAVFEIVKYLWYWVSY